MVETVFDGVSMRLERKEGRMGVGKFKIEIGIGEGKGGNQDLDVENRGWCERKKWRAIYAVQWRTGRVRVGVYEGDARAGL